MLKMDFKTKGLTPKLSLVTLCLVQFYSAHGEAVYYNPRVTGQFLTGGNQQLGGFGDGMVPLFQAPDRMFFANGTVLLGQNQRVTYSGGLGYRQIKNTFLGEAILGVFGFVDYYRTRLNHQYTQINPGLEWLAERYEARLQGYIPASSRSVTYGDTFASAIPQNVLFDSGRSTQGLANAVGHRLIDTPVHLVEDFGPGVELELGRQVNFGKGMWVRAGGYHYSYKNSQDINGVQANLELAIKDSMSLIIQDNYDGQNRNRFAVQGHLMKNFEIR
ncbi:hypothetical protein [Legionella sp. km772]|uniref:hypothetical protein n=1 Tax=Legionella sp. km772 TaxID=2498111 RepID=UPI000F8EC57A|nr:hypothetical protein [Legionella sp. km772]RUR07331.1 hypothetical protein ELY15_12260 [Legionella sp. km772]